MSFLNIPQSGFISTKPTQWRVTHMYQNLYKSPQVERERETNMGEKLEENNNINLGNTIHFPLHIYYIEYNCHV